MMMLANSFTKMDFILGDSISCVLRVEIRSLSVYWTLRPTLGEVDTSTLQPSGRDLAI
jgi:hypothetical protein